MTDEWTRFEHPTWGFSMDLRPGLTVQSERPDAALVAVAESFEGHLPASVVVTIEERTLEPQAWLQAATEAADEVARPSVVAHVQDGYLDRWRRVVRALETPDGEAVVSEQMLTTTPTTGVTLTFTDVLVGYSMVQPEFTVMADSFDPGRMP